MLASCFSLAIVSLLAGQCHSFPNFSSKLPNGARIPHPCNSQKYWSGVGHQLDGGGGPLNPFGRDFLTNGRVYDATLCNLDSDGDGKTNGQELGDPFCQWTFENPTVLQAATSHPGICEPVDSPNCQTNNNFLRLVPDCEGILANEPVTEDWCPEIRQEDVQRFDIAFNKTQLPNDVGIYYCQQFDVPHDAEYHIIAWEPILDNLEVLHHIEMYACDTPEQLQKLQNSGRYHNAEACPIMPEECTGGSLGWALGSPGKCYPNSAGVLMGQRNYEKIILQVHYNNALRRSDLIDSSGLPIYYTRNLRRFDVAGMQIGQMDIAIPPNSADMFTVRAQAFQNSYCSYWQLGSRPSYKITSVLFHMHKIGFHAKLELVKRNGRVLTLSKILIHLNPLCLNF